MGPTNERIDVNTSAAVRGERGFFFGTLRWIHGERLLVEVDAELDAGDRVEVRITLGPGPGTALARAVVQRALVTAKGEIARYVFAVTDVSTEDRHAFETWLRNVKAKGTYHSFDNFSGSAPIAEGMSGASKAETKAALDRMNARSHHSTSAAEIDPFGLRSDVKSVGSARNAMRDALRKAIAAPPQPPPTSIPPTPSPLSSPSIPPASRSIAPASTPPRSVAPPSTPPRSVAPPSTPPRSVAPPSTPPRSVAPVSNPPRVPGTSGSGAFGLPPSARSGLPPMPFDAKGPSRPPAPVSRPPMSVPPEAPRPSSPPFEPYGASRPPAAAPVAAPDGADPTYASTSTRSSAWLEVRWSSPTAFVDDLDALLAEPLLVLPFLGSPLPDKPPLRVMLRHAQFVLDCGGEVVEHGPFGATYRLQLDGLHRRTLEGWRTELRGRR